MDAEPAGARKWEPGLIRGVVLVLVGFVGFGLFALGFVGWLTLQTSYYPRRDEVREIEGRIVVVYVNAPGVSGHHMTFIETPQGRIGQWPGCSVSSEEVPQTHGKHGRALVFKNRVVQVEIDGRMVCEHDPGRTRTTAIISYVLLVMGTLIVLGVVLILRRTSRLRV